MIARPEAPNGSLTTTASLISASVRHEALMFEWR
jgi:hypothetical protein